MRHSCRIILAAILMSLVGATTWAAPTTQQDTCLMFAANNIARGSGNFFIYEQFSDKRVELKPGDALEYDIYLNRANPLVGGGIDVTLGSNGNIRDSGVVDQNHLRAHPDAKIEPAVGKWYHRRILLDKVAGQRARRWQVVFEGDKPGTYGMFIDNVAIVRADGSDVVIYDNGEPPRASEVMKEGYSRRVLLKAVPRDQIQDGADLSKMFEQQMKRLALDQQLDELRAQVELVHKYAQKYNDQHLLGHAQDAQQLLDLMAKNESLDAEAVQSLIHQIHNSLNHEHPEMRKYTGHLVGHAHIDFQWLWEWKETIQVCHDTFNQALKFMDEFPGFKFSQSSSALYATTEEHFPDIFKGIQKQVEAGNWELVGGRVCEGDEHMISPESHARQFLYGQRYFRERFNGKMATVGWEPDTFGHTWQMPQILKLGGCKYFYFCRGGHGNPLFWWQAPDGSKVLAFEEPASGGWYNGDVTMKNFDRLLDFAGKTGSNDMLWVYGVGNHGGGPTRESIEQAIGFQQIPFLPNVKFSTATEFFHQLEQYDLSKIPTVNDDLNTRNSAGFYGTYTSHSDIKRWNRDAEAITESAEAIAAIASRYGFAYPGKEFRRNWEDICWNHHHDTLPGTSIHPSYNLSESMYKRVIDSSRKIGDEAVTFLASKLKTDSDGVLVFNPTGFTRDGVVAGFFASDLPPFGYRFYSREKIDKARVSSDLKASSDGSVIENAEFRLTIDPQRGVVSSIFDKRANRETLAKDGSGNRLEIHWEEADAGAWVIKRITKVEPLVAPVALKVVENGPARVTVAFDRLFGSTTLHQTIALPQHGPPEFGLDTQWKELGSNDKPCPFLKVAFDVECDQPKFVCQIPYGTIEKPTNNTEVPALKFAALCDARGGVALLNDCKHGYSAQGKTIRLSLIRSTHGPDQHPNDRPQSAKWVLLPQTGALNIDQVTAAAESFNHPLWATSAKANPAGQLPSEMSFVSMKQANVVITGVKQAEDDGDLVVRFYEVDGKETASPTPKVSFAAQRTQVVNFVEDVMEGADASAPLRGHEIRTLKLKTSAP